MKQKVERNWQPTSPVTSRLADTLLLRLRESNYHKINLRGNTAIKDSLWTRLSYKLFLFRIKLLLTLVIKDTKLRSFSDRCNKTWLYGAYQDRMAYAVVNAGQSNICYTDTKPTHILAIFEQYFYRLVWYTTRTPSFVLSWVVPSSSQHTTWDWPTRRLYQTTCENKPFTLDKRPRITVKTEEAFPRKEIGEVD